MLNSNTMATLIEKFGAFQSLALGDHWKEVVELVLTDARRSAITFSPNDDESVRVSVYDRGLPLSPEESARFRRVLSGGPRVLIDTRETPVLSRMDECLVEDLVPVLGTAGDNQVLNKETDWQGPCFLLDKLIVESVKGRNVLMLTGCYRNSEENTINTYFLGMFADGSAERKSASIYEFFLEAPDELRFLRYRREYAEALSSLQWV